MHGMPLNGLHCTLHDEGEDLWNIGPYHDVNLMQHIQVSNMRH